MTERIEMLNVLLQKTEDGDLDWPHVESYGHHAVGNCTEVFSSYLGSLDAAKALHEAVVPGWTRAVDATAPELGIEVKLYPPEDVLDEDYSGPARGDHQLSEARAWLIAILKALIAEAKE